MNSPKFPLPPDEFAKGDVTPLSFDAERITKTGLGFTIHMPSEAPVATPAVRDGRLYVSGGFSSSEFYCFDARDGHFIWGVELDDDGASAAVLSDTSILFNTESCTLFVLDAATGKLRWAHWLGDPLMSVPTVSQGRVFTTYPADYLAESSEKAGGGQPVKEVEQAEQSFESPSHILIALDLKTGKTIWRRWIDSECMSSPVASDNGLYLATYSGTVYEFNPRDGEIRSARRLRATSAPVIAGKTMYYTRRTDALLSNGAPAEAIVRFDRGTGLENYLTCRRAAPYLDWRVQARAKSTESAGQFEAKNGIMGGMGGGMMGGSNMEGTPSGNTGDAGGIGGGFFAVTDKPAVTDQEPSEDESAVDPFQEPDEESPFAEEPNMEAEPEEEVSDPLAITEREAAELVGQGNVSMLQSYHGSRILPLADRNVSCMGDAVVCIAASSGKLLWSIPLEGDLHDEGGSLAAPPVLAGSQVFVSTLAGEILQIEPTTGTIKAIYKIGSPMRYPPAVVAGRIYATTQDGKVVCVDTGQPQLSGSPMWYRDPQHANLVAPRR